MHIHTHIRSGVKVKERGTCEKVPVTFTLVFSPHFWGFLCCARFQKEVYCLCDQLLLSPWDWVGLGGWADWQMALFFGFLFFFIQATGERGRCVNNNNDNNVTRVDPSRSLSLVMMVIIIIIITILVNYYYYVPSSIQKKKKSRPLRVH